jgi:hypothetical protein
MKYTNNHNLPDLMVEAITADDYERKVDRAGISVTRLIDSPLIKRLMDDHNDEMEADVSDMLWAMDGKATHATMENVDKERYKTEWPITEVVEGVTVSGRLDVYDTKTATIIDYKRTSIWSVIFQSSKVEYENQLNVYAYLLRGAGYPVKKLQIFRFIKDWRRSEARKDPERYPAIPFIVIDILLWDDKKAEEYLFNRVRLHKLAATSDINFLECSVEERWAKPDTWAVYSKTKDGKKFKERADRVLESPDAAQDYIDKNNLEGAKVEFRPGLDVRCQDYCSVSQFCPYWQKKMKEANHE